MKKANKTKLFTLSAKQKIVYIGIAAILIMQLAIYHVQLLGVKAQQDELEHKMEQTIYSSIVRDLPYYSTVRQTVQSGSVTKKDDEIASQLAETVTSLVLSKISNDYKNELKDLVVGSLMSDIDEIVKKHYESYTAKEANDIASSVKVIVLEELTEYTQALQNEVYETKNLYTAVQNTLARLQDSQNKTNAKISEIQNTYNNEIAKLKQKDSDLQAQINTLKGSQASNKNELTASIEKANKAFNDALKKLQGNTLSTNEDIYAELESVRSALDEADTNLKAQISTLDISTANRLQSEISERKKAVDDAINSLSESGSADKEYLIALLQNANKNLKASIQETADNLSETAKNLSEVDAEHYAEYLEEVRILNQNIEALNKLIEGLDDSKLNINDSPKYNINAETDSITVTIPTTNPNLE